MVRPIGRTEKMTAAEQETAAVIFVCLEKCCQETNTATTSACPPMTPTAKPDLWQS